MNEIRDAGAIKFQEFNSEFCSPAHKSKKIFQKFLKVLKIPKKNRENFREKIPQKKFP